MSDPAKPVAPKRPGGRVASGARAATLAVVTGAASGIGRAVAREVFVSRAAHVILVDIDAAGLERLKNELHPTDGASLPLGTGSVECVVCDVRSDASTQALAATLARHGRLDLLVCCAGIARAEPLESMAPAEFEQVVQTNLVGTFRVIQAALPWLRKSADPVIVNFSSLAGLIGAPGMGAYSASKFGIMGLSEALRVELEGRVAVCVVCPSMTRTPIARAMGAAGLDQILERWGTDPARVARAALDAAKTKRPLTLVTPDAYALHLLKRVAPGLCERLVTRAFRALDQKGAFRK